MAFFRRGGIPGTFRNNSQLQQFVLPGVIPTGRLLATGSYGSVEEVSPSASAIIKIYIVANFGKLKLGTRQAEANDGVLGVCILESISGSMVAPCNQTFSQNCLIFYPKLINVSFSLLSVKS